MKFEITKTVHGAGYLRTPGVYEDMSKADCTNLAAGGYGRVIEEDSDDDAAGTPDSATDPADGSDGEADGPADPDPADAGPEPAADEPAPEVKPAAAPKRRGR